MIKFRLAKPEDAEQILNIYKYYIDTTISFEYPYPDIESYRDYIKKISAYYPYIVAEEDGVILGYCYASAFRSRRAYDCSVETTIYLNRDQLRHGLGTKLYHRLFEILKHQGFVKGYACIVYPYEISVNFHKKFGFSECGLFKDCAYKEGNWLSVIYMENAIQNISDLDNYSFPKPINDLDKSLLSEILS